MTVEEAKALVKRVSFDGFTPKLSLHVAEVGDCLHFTVNMVGVKDSDTGVEGSMASEPYRLPVRWLNEKCWGETDLLNVLWEQCLMPALDHELSEHFRLNGKRVYEPHPGRKP